MMNHTFLECLYNIGIEQARSYSLLYEELDEKAVEIVRILGFSTNSSDTK